MILSPVIILIWIKKYYLMLILNQLQNKNLIFRHKKKKIEKLLKNKIELNARVSYLNILKIQLNLENMLNLFFKKYKCNS